MTTRSRWTSPGSSRSSRTPSKRQPGARAPCNVVNSSFSPPSPPSLGWIHDHPSCQAGRQAVRLCFMAKEGVRNAGREEEEGVSARGREGVGVGEDDQDREAAREAIKASVDLIRLASNAQARWSEDSIANAISWLQSAEAWAKHERARDLVISVIQVSPWRLELAMARRVLTHSGPLLSAGARRCAA